MQIEVFLFDDFTAMDFIGPVEALQRLPETTVRYVSLEGGLVKNAQGLRIMTERAEDVHGDMLPSAKEKNIMSEIKGIEGIHEFLGKAGTFFLATEDGEQPKTRPLSFQMLENGNLPPSLFPSFLLH